MRALVKLLQFTFNSISVVESLFVLVLGAFQTKSQVMNQVRNLGYVSGKLEVEKVDSSDRKTAARQSIFDVKTAKEGSGATRQPIRSELPSGARRSLDSQRSTSS